MRGRFTEQESAAWGGLLSTYHYLERVIDEDLRVQDGLSHVEFEVLLRLWRAPDRRLRVQELAEASLLTRSGMSRLVERLVSVGLVDRQPDPDDGRASLVTMTDAGRDCFEAAAPRHMALVREVFLSRLSASQIDALGKIWAAVRPD